MSNDQRLLHSLGIPLWARRWSPATRQGSWILQLKWMENITRHNEFHNLPHFTYYQQSTMGDFKGSSEYSSAWVKHQALPTAGRSL